ncbi:MAG: Hsp33 family molecular chaperone HslO [Pseudobdellovibrio sp.]|nr:Hsp33 family molecular chaperone HslO [Pseudobdellovibrio sp.]
MSKIHRYCSNDFTVRIAAIDATQVVQEMQMLQNTLPIATVGVGKAMTGALLMAAQLKEKQQVGLLFRGNGSIKSIYAEADFEGNVRAFTPHPQYEPQNYDKGLSVAEALGTGTLSVARHQPFQKQPFHGTVSLVTGEIAEDLAHYLHQSHQIRSVVALGIYLDEYGKCKKAGGVIIEVMPGVDEKIVSAIEANAQIMQPSVSKILMEGGKPFDLVEPFMLGVPFTELDHPYEAKYFCPCNKDRVKGALEILGMAELQDIIDKNQEQEVVCQMCGKPYLITVEEVVELKELLYKNSMH